MSTLDQAFIKAYTRQGEIPAGQLQSAPTVPLSEALEDHARQQSADTAEDTSQQVAVDGLLEELNRMSPVGEKSDQADKDRGEEAPTIDELDFTGVVHRLDREVGSGSLDTESTGTSNRVAPEPHVDVVAFAVAAPNDVIPNDAIADNVIADNVIADNAIPNDAITGDAITDDSEDEEVSLEAEAPIQPITGVSGAFQPMLQVDHYTWPSACRRLGTEAAHELDRMADGLAAAVIQGNKALAIGGCRSGEGTTTLLLCAARRLADRGHKVIMVDANFANPRLAQQLGLLPQFGWEEVLAGRLPLEEVAIESTRNELAVLPLLAPLSGEESSDTGDNPAHDQSRLADSIRLLVENYDAVLVDLGPLEDPDAPGGALAQGIGAGLDGVVLVQDVRTTTDDKLAEIRRHLSAAGIAQPGIIQNYAPA